MGFKVRKRVLAAILCLALVCSNLAYIPAKVMAQGNLSVYDLKVDSEQNPIGIDNEVPLFSWKIDSGSRGITQSSYQIAVSSTAEKLQNGDYDMWDSGIVDGDDSLAIPYEGAALSPRTRYFWKVEVTDNGDNQAVSEETAFFETGMMDLPWDAQWIELDQTGIQPNYYTIEYDFRIEQDAAGFIFAAKDTNNFLMWQVNLHEQKFGGKTSFRPHKWVSGGAGLIDEFLIDDVIPEAEQHDQHHMKIEVDGQQVTTWIDDVQIDQRNMDLAGYGKIGFRQNRAGSDDERAAYDNILIRDADENVLFEDNFDGNISTNFSFGTISEGELHLDNMLGLQNDNTYSAPMYRKEFTLDKPVKKATVYATALGIYELEINGAKVSDDLFNPGWTAYELNQDDNNYVMYQTFDVTDMVSEGANVIGGMTGHGWYSGKLFVGGKERYGKGSKLLCQMELEFQDGSTDRIVTDGSWTVSGAGPITADDFQLGESYDANKEIDGWSTTDYQADSSWSAPVIGSYSGDIIAQIGPKVKEIQEFKPKEITEITPGTYIVNLGQNISGYARLRVTGEQGTTVKIRFGEMLKQDGTLYTDNLRSATSTDYYTLRGLQGGEEWKPRFTFHGFQYMEVTGYPGELTADDITGIAISSLQDQVGDFTTSNADVNQLQSNIVWGELDNFISVPTDCPQRDERLGYTGDSQVFVRTSAMNRDTQTFFRKFLKDVSTNQRDNGMIADWVPNYVTPGDGYSGSFGASGWGDAIVVIPWTMYTTYGDKVILEENYEAMKKWVAYYESIDDGDYIVSSAGNNYGDWLSIDADTPRSVTNTGFYAYSTDLLSKVAGVLGKTEDQEYYQDLFENIKDGFNRRLIDADGHVEGRTQTSYLVALKYNLLEDQEAREKAAAYLVEDIKNRGWHLTTGFIGVSYLCPILTEMGYADVAYRLLLQDTYPSWLYSVKNGATTIWERWNSYVAETGQFGDVGMNSFNHYSQGSVGEWFYTYVVGIKYDENAPGFKHMFIDPYIGGGLDYAGASFDSPYGLIESGWEFGADGALQMQIRIPANTTAQIHVPAVSADDVYLDGVKATDHSDLTFVRMDEENGKAIFAAGSGEYVFTTSAAKQCILNIVDGESSKQSLVSVNGGEWQTLPIIEEVSFGDTVKLLAAPLNEIDYKFKKWGGDLEAKDSKITFTISGNTRLAVYNSERRSDNLALGKPVNANSAIENTDWGTSRLTDGKLTSSTGSLGYTSNQSETANVDYYVEVDLEEAVTFDRIHLYPRTDVKDGSGKTASFPKDFSIQVWSETDSQYRTVQSYEDYEAPEGVPAVLMLGEEFTSSKVRICVTRLGNPPAGEKYYLQLAELAVYRGEVPTLERITAAATKTSLLWDETAQIKDVKAISSTGAELDLGEAVITYKSSDSNIIKVDKDGKITAANAGRAVVTVEVVFDGKKASKEIGIHVSEKTPEAPQLLKKSRNSIELKKISGYEYAIEIPGKPLAFSANTVFKNLKANTTYKLYQRFAATATHWPGSRNAELKVTTDKEEEKQTETNKETEEKEKKPTSVKLNVKKSITLGQKEKLQLKATVLPKQANQKVTWRSSKKSVVQVSSKGKITAKKVGKATITATAANGKKASLKVTVKKAPKKITLSAKKKTMKRKKTYKIRVKLPKKTASYKLTYSSSKKSVATVSAAGRVTAKKRGTAIITVKTFNGKKARIRITVK